MSSKTKPKIFLNKKRTLSIHSTNSTNKSEEPELKKGPWSEQEDQLLKKWVKANGPCNWTKCSDFIKGRSGKQCREHWNNSLDPQLTKGQWTSEEDLLIMVFYKKYGGSWKKIIPIFEKRTENSIKNRFFSQLRKIASKYHQTGKKEYSTKFGLETLLKFLEKGKEQAEQKFFSENIMKKKEFEEYVNKIDILVKNRKKGKKFIDLSILKNNNGQDANKFLELNEDEDEDGDEDEEEEYINKKQNMETPKKNKKRGRKKMEQKNAQKRKINTLKKTKSTEKTKDLSENEELNQINKETIEIKRSKSQIKDNIIKDEEKSVKGDNNIKQNNEENDIKNNKNEISQNDIKRKNTITNQSKDEKNKVRREGLISTRSTGLDENIKEKPFSFDKNTYKITPYKANNKDFKRKDTLEEYEKQNKRNECRPFRYKNYMLYGKAVINSQNYKDIKKNGFKEDFPFPSFDNLDLSNNNFINFKNNISQFEYDKSNIIETKEIKFVSPYMLRSRISFSKPLSKLIIN